MTGQPISEKQVHWINVLVNDRQLTDSQRTTASRVLENGNRAQASALLDILFAAPKLPKATITQAAVPQLDKGTYESGEVIFRVQLSNTTGKHYAKVWNGRTWEYDGSAYRKHAATAVIVPLERALAIGIATGHCVCCARDLTDSISVEAGIGPVCVKRYGTTREAIISERNAARELASV